MDSSNFVKRFESLYESVFSIEEIRNSKALKVLFWVILLHYSGFLANVFYIADSSIQASVLNTAICWPHFQSCESLYFFNYSNWGFGQSTFYLCLFMLLFYAAASAYKGHWRRAHAALMVLALWRFFHFFILTFTIAPAYEYYSQPFAILFLFSPNKLMFMRICLALLYFLSAQVKFHESWIVGNYFTSQILGMPYVSNFLVPFGTQAVILFEILTPWLLVSQVKKYRIFSLYLWLFFHFYSVLIVGVNYPFVCIPLLLALYGINETSVKYPELQWKHSMTALIFLFLLGLHAVPHWIEGDIKYSLEGYKYGVGMIDANHQCIGETKVHYKDGTTKVDEHVDYRGHHRCSIYSYWYWLRKQCTPSVDRIEWKLNHSINGGPFYQMVDSQNMCELNYHAFKHNEWIIFPEEGAKIVGYPRPNVLWGNSALDYQKKFIFETPRENALASSQIFMGQYVKELKVFYWLGWFLTLIYAIRMIYKKQIY